MQSIEETEWTTILTDKEQDFRVFKVSKVFKVIKDYNLSNL